MKEAGLYKNVDELGNIIEPKKREFYVPDRLREATEAERDGFLNFGIKHKVMHDDLVAGAAKQKRSNYKFVEDPVAQFYANAEELSRLGRNSSAVKEMAQHMGPQLDDAGNVVSRMARTFASTEEAQKAAKVVNSLGDVKYTVLEGDLAKTYQRIAKEVGQSTGGAVVMPESAAKVLQNLTKAYVPPSDGMRAYMNFQRSVGRPLSKLWRINRTILRPGHHVEDFVGALTYGYIAHGVSLKGMRNAPAILGSAIAASLDGTKAAKSLGKVASVKFADGSSAHIDDLIKIMKDNGVIDMMGHRLGLDMAMGQASEMSSGVKKVGKVLEKGVDLYTHGKFSPVKYASKVARFTDDYLHASVFINRLKGTKPEQVAEALKFMHEWAPTYRRLSSFEKDFLKDGFGFYSFGRFAVKQMFTATLKSPARMARLKRITDSIGRETNKNMGSSREGLASWQEDMHMAPTERQNPKLKAHLENPKSIPEPGSHEFTVMLLQDPYAIALGYLKPLLMSGQHGYSSGGLMAAIPKLAAELLLGTDVDTFEEQPRTDAVTKFAKGFTPVGVEVGYKEGGLEAMWKVYQARGLDADALSFATKLAAFRWLTGMRVYEARPLQTAAKESKEAIYKDAPAARKRQ
jgi:uncharacterized protein (DUF697 family)